MATKKIKKAGNYEFEVGLKSKDTTYVFKNNEIAKQSTLDFTLKNSDDYYYAQEGNDLFIVGEFYDNKKYTKKVVLTTIKDYFLYNTANENVVLIGDEKPDLDYMSTYVSAKTVEDDADGIDVIGGKKNTTYNLKKLEATYYGYSDYVDDLGGNDTYNINTYYSYYYPTSVHVYDWEGNDKYNISAREGYSYTSYFALVDEKGNDEYNIKNAYVNNSHIYDYAGKDKYTVSDSRNMLIYDVEGKDKYDISNSSDIELHDGYYAGGNDKYTISGSSEIYLDDRNGDDKYTISKSSEIRLEDDAGNDKYSFSELIGDSTSRSYFNDDTGNDKYTVSDSSYLGFYDSEGNDKWTISNSGYIEINEESGNDTYKVVDKDKSSSNISIEDILGNDNYKFERTLNVNIEDGAGNDKYSFTKVINDDTYITDNVGDDKWTISESDITISDKAGIDTYDIKKSVDTRITDYTDSNDTYKLDNLAGDVVINDKGGSKDKLTISSLKSKNVIFMADFTADGNGVSDGTLYLLDKTKTGHATLCNYFDTKDYEGKKVYDITKDGAGRIETVKAGSKNITAKIDDFSSITNIVELSATVAGWLNTNEFGSVNALLTSGTDEQVQDFIAYIQNPQPLT